MSERTVITAPTKIKLADYNPADTGQVTRQDADDQLTPLKNRLTRLQDLLYAAQRHSVLIVLQGMDTSGKDGTINHVVAGVNPSGCEVASFKVPTPAELRHDFLWRVHRRTPELGMMAIFNRSHYEDVLAARVHELVPRKRWQERYAQINHFEHLLAHSDTLIFKFFLHISSEEQERRLLDREKDLDKAWKISVADWQERRFWDRYCVAYEDAIGQCSAEWAPWYIVPADKKWYRNYLVARTLVEQLGRYERQWTKEVEDRGRQELAELRRLHGDLGTNSQGDPSGEPNDD